MIPLAAKSDDKCDEVVKTCNKLVQDLKDEISVRIKLEERMHTYIVEQHTELEKQKEDLSSPLKNPYIMLLAGALVGSLLTFHFSK